MGAGRYGNRRRQWHPTPVLLPGKSHGWRRLVGCSPRGRKESTLLSDFTFIFHFHALEKEMATHSSVLAWRIPGTGEPGGLPSMGLYRVGHDWSDSSSSSSRYGKLAWEEKCNYLPPLIQLTLSPVSLHTHSSSRIPLHWEVQDLLMSYSTTCNSLPAELALL